MPTTYEPIATSDISAVNTFTFSSIPSTYTDLRLVIMQIRGIEMIFNGSETGYSQTNLSGNGTAASSSRNTDRSALYPQGFNGGSISLCTIDIFSYAGSTFKTSLSAVSADMNGSGRVERNILLWRNTSAINSILIRTGLESLFGTGACATLYGIKAA